MDSNQDSNPITSLLQLLGLQQQPQYAGMYPGADPYAKAQMLQEGIPSAQQEALQAPAVDPVTLGVIGTASLVSNPGILLNPGGSGRFGFPEGLGQYGVNAPTSYLMNQLLQLLGSKQEAEPNNAH